MIVHQEPGMLFAMHLFRPRGRAARVEDTETQEAAGPALASDMGDNARPRGRAASRRANILFMDMAANKRKRKGK